MRLRNSPKTKVHFVLRGKTPRTDKCNIVEDPLRKKVNLGVNSNPFSLISSNVYDKEIWDFLFQANNFNFN